MTNIIALAEGTDLVGDYTIERVLGAGGFGITYLAREIQLDRLVTIKEYFPSDFAARKDGFEAVPRSQDSTGDYNWGLERFVSEAQTLAKFNHPHIVGVHRYFRANNTAYMVLHYEEGQSLKNWLKTLGRVPRQADLDRIMPPLLDALELIHNADFLHRDIAPDNIIIRKNGQPVLIDFGSARGEIARHSKTISALVKPGYSPYEQYAEKNSRQGPWTDIYALGATLYFAVTKKRPADAVLRVTKDEYRPVSELALGAYRKRFLRAIDKALAVDIGSRPQSVAAWRGEILGPDAVKQSWLSRRRRKPEQEQDPLADAADEPSSDPGDGHTAPPPPDAPGRKGGMLDFVEGLKKPRQPLGDALRAEAVRAETDGDTALKTNPNNPQKPAQAAPADPKPLPETVRLDEPFQAPLFPKKRKPEPERRREPQPPRPEPQPAQSDASDHPHQALPVPYEAPRKPPKPPGESFGRRTARWAASLVKMAIIGLIAATIYVNRDKLPNIDLSGLKDFAASFNKPVPPNGQPSLPAKTTPAPKPEARAAAVRRDVPRPAERVRTIAAHNGPITAAAYGQKRDQLISAGKDATLRIWSAATGQMKRIINMDHGEATSLAVRGRYAATGHQNGYAAVWDLEAGTKIADLRRNEAPVWSLTFTNSGRLAVAAHDWTVSLWDIRKPEAPIHVLSGHDNPVQAVALSSNGKFLASGGADRQLRLWDLNTLDRIRTYRRQGDFISAISFSPDDRLVASGTLNGGISIFRPNSRSRVRRLGGHDGEITAMAFSPDGALFITASKDSTIRVRETRRWRTLKTLPDHQGPVTALAIAPDGQTFATAGADGTLRIWATRAFKR